MKNVENMEKNGMAREPWPRVKLGDVCKVVLGGTPKTAIKEYWGGNIPWLTPGEMGKIKGPYVNDTNRKLTQKGLESGSSLFPARSVMLSTRAPIGYVFINEVPMATNQGCKTLVPSESIWPEFLYYNLLGRTDELNNLGTGTTFKELATGALKGISLPLPPLAVQRSIVSRLERELGAVEKVAKKFEEIERAAEGEFKATLKETFDEISRGGAETRRLGDVCEEVRNRISSAEVGVDAYVTTDNMLKNCAGVASAEYVPENVGLVHYQKGDVLLANIRPYLKKLWRADKDGGCSSDVVVFRSCRTNLSSEYLFVALSQDRFFDYVMQNPRGTKMPRGDRDWMKYFSFPLPPLATQRAIVSRLDAARVRRDGLVAAAKDGREAAALWRKAILKEAFK